MDSVLIDRPALNGFDLYASAVRTGTACHSSYNALLGADKDPQAAQQAESRLLSLFKKSPTIIENSHLLAALAR